jgi:hypothetical protein
MPDKFDISLYNSEFFQWHQTHAREYSIRTMDWYIQKYKPSSVADFGCGIGSYLESAHNHKIPVVGFDIAEEARALTPIAIRPFIRYFDCTKPIALLTPYHTVISFETAEHINPSGTDIFVDNLVCATGNTLLFTAAPPGQDGTGHINLHPREFWVDKISKRITYNESITKDISDNWRNIGAPKYICDNLIVFCR